MLKSKSLAVAAVIGFVSANSAVFAETGRIQIEGVKSLSVAPTNARDPSSNVAQLQSSEIDVGDMLPLQYMMVVNLERLHLPRPKDGWVYFEVGQNILRVDLNSREVLEQMVTLSN